MNSILNLKIYYKNQFKINKKVFGSIYDRVPDYEAFHLVFTNYRIWQK